MEWIDMAGISVGIKMRYTICVLLFSFFGDSSLPVHKENNGNNHFQITSHQQQQTRGETKRSEKKREINKYELFYEGDEIIMYILRVLYTVHCTRAHIDVITCVILFIGYMNAGCGHRLHEMVFAFVLRTERFSFKLRMNKERHNVVGARWCVWIKLLFSSIFISFYRFLALFFSLAHTFFFRVCRHHCRWSCFVLSSLISPSFTSMAI